MSWFTSPAHFRWLDAETRRLIEFGKASAHPEGGFGWLDKTGKLTTKPVELWITSRMTHIFALGELMGFPGCANLVEHGLDALLGRLRDPEHDGWYAAVTRQGDTETVVKDTKEAYGHAFVLLAASSAVAAKHARGQELLNAALAVNNTYFWNASEGMSNESWDREFLTAENYRGVNANMHTVECYLAVADVTEDVEYLHRAARIVERVIHGFARENEWRIPEHFTHNWELNLQYNVDAPADAFRPFGATIGHALEWSRLTLSTRAALLKTGEGAPDWMLDDALALFDVAISDGWSVDGADGFVYTTDWAGVPVVRNRMHWVAAEAIGAAVAVHQVTGSPEAEKWYRLWWDYVDQYLIDKEHGSWYHELDPENDPAAITWDGKPDIYHAVQALLLPRLPLTPSFGEALSQGLLP